MPTITGHETNDVSYGPINVFCLLYLLADTGLADIENHRSILVLRNAFIKGGQVSLHICTARQHIVDRPRPQTRSLSSGGL